MTARRRYCVARMGCQGLAVTTVPAPRGTVGRVSACASCYERATGKAWTGATLSPVEPPAPRKSGRITAAPVLLDREPKTGRRQDRRASERELRSMTTRILLWMQEQGRPVGQVEVVRATKIPDRQVWGVLRNLHQRGWTVEGGRSLSADGAREATLRRAELAELEVTRG